MPDALHTLLDRLHRVRMTARGQWVACCPAHDDLHPSLSIARLDDGRILVHCFAGCAPGDVMRAVGMSLADLMPGRLGDHLPGTRWHPRTVLEAIANNVTIIAMLAIDAAHRGITLEDKDKMVELAGEILDAVSYATK